MEITYKIFCFFCNSAESADEGLFDAMRGDIQHAQLLTEQLVGAELIDHLNAVEYDVTTTPFTNEESLIYDMTRYICASAYYDAIPQLDLVLTSTGFGIVSNANVAPASADRVEKLRKRMEEMRDIYYDMLLDRLRTWESWSTTLPAYNEINSLFWRCQHLSILGIHTNLRSDLVAQRNVISQGELVAKRVVSPEFFDELVQAERTGSATSSQRTAIAMIRSFVAAVITQNQPELHHNALLRYLDNLITEFPTYQESSEYKARQSPRYENKKDDSCFFFG